MVVNMLLQMSAVDKVHGNFTMAKPSIQDREF